MKQHPELVPGAVNPDLRGQHIKVYGEKPDRIHVEGFPVEEVFLTTNHKDVVRGIHFQKNPAQPKILTCVAGKALVQVVDLVEGSPNYGRAVITKVFTPATGEDRDATMVVVPPQHGLGYRILEEGTIMLYLAAAPFSGEGDVGVDPFDEDLDLDWGLQEDGTPFRREDAILSPRDQELPRLKDLPRQA